MNRSLRLAASFALLATGAVVAAGCSSSGDDPAKVQDEQQTDGSGGDGGAGGGSDGSSALSCDTLSNHAEAALGAASASAETDLSCSTDSDCTLLQDDPASCIPGCGQIVNSAGAALIESAASSASVTSICTQFAAQGCQVVELPCPLVGPAAQCVAGACKPGYPAAWTTLALESDTGGTGEALPVRCDGTACTLWTVTPDATVTTLEPSGATKTATLSSADFATVDGILRDGTFRQDQLTDQFGCSAAVGAQHVTVGVDRPDGGATGEDVSGCISGGPSDNDWKQIYDVLQRYL
jgi:hypothetical protein